MNRPRRPRSRSKSQRRRDNYNAHRHAKTRANERYGLHLTNTDLQTITKVILQRRSRFIAKQPLNREIHILTHQGVNVAVLYDPRSQLVISTLPSDHYELTKRGITLIDPRLAPLANLKTP